MKKRTAIALLFGSVLLLNARTSVKTLIDAGLEKLKQAEQLWQEEPLMEARAYFERLSNLEDEKGWTLYYLAYAESRLVNYYFAQDDLETAKPFIAGAIEHLESSLVLQPDCADAKALLALVLGNKIATAPMSGITLGPRSARLLAEAFALEPGNPRVSLIAGQSDFYTPRMFGGGKDKALRHFEQAIEYYADDAPAEALAPTWGEIETHVYIGLCHMDAERFSEARRAFKTVLEKEPGHAWVTHALMPELEKRIKEKQHP